MLVTAVCAATLLGAAVHGQAAGTTVVAGRMTTLRPSQLPPKCSTVTVVADADTYVNQGSPGTNYGSSTTLSVLSRNNANNRALIRFPLPAAPAGCTLGSATLRVRNGSATTGRTIVVNAVGSSWTESTVTWTSNNGNPSGTGVNASAVSGTMQWGVTALVQSMYAGANHGFVLRDSVEQNGGSNTNHLQLFSSRDTANTPELVLLWQ